MCIRDRFKWAVNRQAGMGMKFIKFHLLLHLSDDLNWFGPSYSSPDRSAGEESMHKGFKEDANHTQKNSATFDSQIAKNHSESQAINRANSEVNPPSPLDAAGDDDFAVAIGLHFYVDKDGMFEVDHKKPASKSQQMASWVDINLMASVTRYGQEYILPFVPDDRVMLLTQAKVYGTLYQANPCYQSIHKEIGCHDWVNVQWS